MSTITIDHVRGEQNSSGELVGLVVEVTLGDCDWKEVIVKVGCHPADGSGNIVKEFPTGTDGTEQLTFTAHDLEPLTCSCGDRVSVSAECAGPESSIDYFDGQLLCDCPVVDLPQPDVADECTNNTREVTLKADFSNVNPNVTTQYQWEWGDATGASLVDSISSDGLRTETHDYAPGQYTAKLHVTNPPNCSTQEVTFDVPACPTSEECPTIDSIDVQPGPCVDDGQSDEREVTLGASVSGGSADTFHWTFGDGDTSAPIDAGANPNAQVTHRYPAPGTGPNSYTVELTVIGENSDECVESMSKTFDVMGCGEECPEVSGDVDVESLDCEDGKRVMRFDPPIVSDEVDTAIWDWKDGTPREYTAPDEQGVEHAFEDSGSKTIEVTFEGPGNCVTTLTEDVYVEPCPGSDDGDDDDDDGENGDGDGGDDDDGGDGNLACGIARVAAAVLLALGILTGLLAACIPAAATELAIAAGALVLGAIIVGAIFAALCDDTPCRWMLLATGQAVLAAGLTATIFSTCCPWILWVGILLTLAGIGILVGWRAACDETWCRVAAEASYVIGGIVLPLFGVVTAIPVVQGCVNYTILGVVSGISGGTMVGAIGCARAGDDE